MSRIRWWAVVVVASLAWAPSAAQAVLMSSLLSGGSLTCGDKLFNTFTYVPTNNMPLAGAVNVNCVTVAGNEGLRFQGGFRDLAGGSSSTASIGYIVKVLDPTKIIVDAHLQGNMSFIGAGTAKGSTRVIETFPSGPSNSMTVFNNHNPAVSSQLLASTVFTQGFTTLHVHTDICGLAGGPAPIGNAPCPATGAAPAGLPLMSFLDETFSQATIPAPEPGTLVLLGTGLLGLVGGVWWRRRSMKHPCKNKEGTGRGVVFLNHPPK